MMHHMTMEDDVAYSIESYFSKSSNFVTFTSKSSKVNNFDLMNELSERDMLINFRYTGQ